MVFPNVHSFLSGLPISVAGMAACLAIYFASAVLSGLSGFGFSALGALSMIFLPPQIAVGMLMTVSLVTQLYSLKLVMQGAPASSSGEPLGFGDLVRMMAPYAVGGVFGLYVGIKLLSILSAAVVCSILGAFLVVYAIYGIHKPASLRLTAGGSAGASGVIGFFSTMIGAFCGGPGIVLMAWLQLRALPKDLARSMAQPFIIFMQVVGLGIFVLKSPAIFSVTFFESVAILLPVALLGSAVGVKIYARASDLNYRMIVMYFLLGSGIALAARAIWG